MSASWWSKHGSAGGSAPATATATTHQPAATNSSTSAGPTITTASIASFFSGKPAATTASVPATQPQTQSQQQTQHKISSEAVLNILKGLKLDGSPEKYQTTPIFAKSNDVMLGGEDAKIVGLRWFRAAEGGRFDELNVSQAVFQPSVDDVGNRLCVQCYDLADQTSSSFAEYGPIKLDPKTAEAVAVPDAKVTGIVLGGIEHEVSRSQMPPHLYCLKRSDTAFMEESIFAWKIVPGDGRKVLLSDGRELVFQSPFDRDVASLLIKSNPPRSRAGSVASVASIEEVEKKKEESEKQLRERIMELEAQLMAARARGGAAETGKALAEAQSLRRELEKVKQENAALNEQITSLKRSKGELEDKIRQLERDLALSNLRDQAHTNLQTELDATKESLTKVLGQYAKTKERAEKAELALDELDRTVPSLESRAKRAEEKVAFLEGRLASAVSEAERAVGRKNAAQQKADSLAKDLARLLKATPGGLEEVEATIRENAQLKTHLEEARNELKATRSAYEAQLAAGKVHSAKAASASIGTPGGHNKLAQLEHLANSLMTEVKSKDETIEDQKAEIDRLRMRVHELQKRAKDRAGDLSG